MKSDNQNPISMSFSKLAFVAVLILFLFHTDAIAQDELNVIQGNASNTRWIYYRDAPNALYHHLSNEVFQLLDKREEAVSKLKTRSDWEQRRLDIRQSLTEIIGPFPEKSPLNPQIMRSIEKDFFTVEHIVFESQPGFHVSSSLYIPHDIQKPAPAILYASGHADVGYRSATYQHKIMNLVKKGFIVFAFDPVSQGERVEYYDPETGESFVGSSTREHCYSGVQAFTTGSSLARHMIWDGIRAVDYLMTRGEVDPGRIGMTGRSGGGTQTAYTAAMDDRILAAAPEAYISNFRRLMQTIGPQDAEQNLFHGLLHGIDHADFLAARAPKPVLIISTTEDFFSIQGARESARELSKMYDALGHSDYFGMVEDGGGHTSTKSNRESMYAFFQKHLNHPGNPMDEEVDILGDDELQVTPTGQLATSLGGETIFTLNRKLAQEQVSRLQTARTHPERHFPASVTAAKELSGYREPSGNTGSMPAGSIFTGQIQREGYVIEKYFTPGEGDYVIPYLLFLPDQPNGKALLYLHPEGKAAEAGEQGEIAMFVENGFTVLAPDLIGTGEMGPGMLSNYRAQILDFDSVSFDVWFTSVKTGRSITGIQAGDAVRLARSLLEREQIASLYAAARGEMSAVLLHAAAFEPDIEHVALIEPFLSFRSVAMTRYYDPSVHHNIVAGALGKYDLPDLAGSLAPRSLVVSRAVDASGKCHDREGIREDADVIRMAYEHHNAKDRLQIATCDSGIDGDIRSWLPFWFQ